MRHYLITRFNLRVPGWRNVDREGQQVLDDCWLRHRFHLFEEHTIPSVMAQTTDNHLWLVLFDTQTPKCWLRRIRDYCEFLPLFMGANWLRELQQFLSHDPMGWLATTRLDNDDTIEPTFIQTIHSALNAKKQFLNMPNGYTLRDGKREPARHTANPFMTYVERGANPQTIYFIAHGQAMRTVAPIRQISTERLWTTIIHERNYIND